MLGTTLATYAKNIVNQVIAKNWEKAGKALGAFDYMLWIA